MPALSIALLADIAGTAFPTPLDQYPAAPSASLVEVLAARVRLAPFNLVATGIFVLAVVHTFVAVRFRALAHDLQERHDAEMRAAGREPEPSVASGILHFFGEVEVVFGLWGAVLAAAIGFFHGWSTAKYY